MRTVKGLRRQIFFILTVGISTSLARDAKDIYDLTLGELASLRIFSGAALTKTEAGKVPYSVTLTKGKPSIRRRSCPLSLRLRTLLAHFPVVFEPLRSP